MSDYTLMATSSFGLESLVALELRKLGYERLLVENGKVTFSGNERDICRCNLWLRTADRILIRMAQFRATDFEGLFQGVLSVPWEDMIPVNGKIVVTGRSVGSRLASVPDCQAVVKKAVVRAMTRKYRVTQFPETGSLYKIEVALAKDLATLTVDTTGPGLHKRGYRQDKGEAPLRENLAAALVLLSRWTPERILADPLCGAGTIAIEAALIGRNKAPGLMRTFVSEAWHTIPKTIWDSARSEALKKEELRSFRILASDSNGRIVKAARDNAFNAGVGELIGFQKLPVEDFKSGRKYGCIVCNPPYGDRMGSAEEIEKLYRSMGKVFGALDGWSLFILSAHPSFEVLFGRKADKNRKLYNGNVKCYFYEYFGPLPRKKATDIEPGTKIDEQTGRTTQ